MSKRRKPFIFIRDIAGRGFCRYESVRKITT